MLSETCKCWEGTAQSKCDNLCDIHCSVRISLTDSVLLRDSVLFVCCYYSRRFDVSGWLRTMPPSAERVEVLQLSGSQLRQLFAAMKTGRGSGGESLSETERREEKKGSGRVA